MPVFRVVFKDKDRDAVQFSAFQVLGNKPTDKGDSYTFRNNPDEVVAIIPKDEVLYIKCINSTSQ